MYVLIRDIYAKLLLEDIDEKFQDHNQELLGNIEDILTRDISHVFDKLSSSDELKGETSTLKSEIYNFKKQNIYLKTLLNDITEHLQNK